MPLSTALFCRYLANQRSSIVPPYAPHTTADLRGDHLRSPHLTPRHIRARHVSAYTHPPRYIDTTYGYQFAPWLQTAVRQLHPKSRYRLDLSYDAGASRGRREAGRYMSCWCGVVWDAEGEGGLPVRRQSYRGYRLELWRIADWLKNDKIMQLKVTRRVHNSGVFLGLHPAKQAQ